MHHPTHYTVSDVSLDHVKERLSLSSAKKLYMHIKLIIQKIKLKIKSENLINSLENYKFLHNVFLLYGPNYGLVDLLYKKIIDILCIDLNNPFNVSKIDGNTFKDNPFILTDNISTFSMSKDKRIVIVRFNKYNSK